MASGKVRPVLILSISLLTASLTYPYRSTRQTCKALFAQCMTDITESAQHKSCMKLNWNYGTNCYDDNGMVSRCTDKCKASFKKLLKHPTFKHFQDCDCLGDTMCIQQKCVLMDECLGKPCKEKVADKGTSSQKSASRNNSLTTSTGMFSTSSPFHQGQCENIILLCTTNESCGKLLEARTKACEGYQSGFKVTCSKECVYANLDLLDNEIGKNLKSCVFKNYNKPDTKRINGITKNCDSYETIISSATKSGPSLTESIPPSTEREATRPLSDCKRHYDACNKSQTCIAGWKNLVTNCYKNNQNKTCTEECVEAMRTLRSNEIGVGLMECKCDDERHNSKHCKTIKGILLSPCSISVDIITTSDYSLGTSSTPLETIQNPVPKFYNGHTGCRQNEINVTIQYSSEVRIIPHLFLADSHCNGTHKKGNTVEFRFSPTSCNTTKAISRQGTVYRNAVYFGSKDNAREILYNISCRVPEQKKKKQDLSNKTSKIQADLDKIRIFLYKDRGNSTTYREGIAPYQKHIFVKINHDKLPPNHMGFVETCFATPNGDPRYSHSHYFLVNGCREDTSFKLIQRTDSSSKFSFYSMGFKSNSVGRRVYIHCTVAVCSRSDRDCKFECRSKTPASYATKNVTTSYIYNAGIRLSPNKLMASLVASLVARVFAT